jgi:hypothetical protein
VCQQLYAHLSAAERVAAATPAGACYRTAGRWRENRAEELASADPDARADASLQLGY